MQRHAPDGVIVMRRAARERAPRDAGFASDSSTDGHKKIFLHNSRNRVVDDPMGMRIERIARIRIACASPRAVANATAADGKCVSKRLDVTDARTIRSRRRRFGVAVRSFTAPHDAAEALSVGDRTVDATGCDDSSHRMRHGAADR